MKTAEHFVALREQFAAVPQEEIVEVTLEELARILDCTQRNVVLLLKKMADQHWLDWMPERGRGRRSRLAFHVGSDTVLVQLAKQMVERNDFRGAMELLQLAPLPESVQSQFNSWLFSRFGHSAEWKNRKKIDILRCPLPQPFYTLDPLHINYAIESHLVHQLFDRLVCRESRSGRIVPHLAHAWESAEDGTVWRFYLRKGVLFHHGRELDAYDVRYSLLRLKHAAERPLYSWASDGIRSIEAIEPNCLRIELMQRNTLFLDYLSTHRASIVPEDICAAQGEQFGRQPVGSGPFRLALKDDQVCVLEAFPHYFQGRAHLDKVELWSIPGLYEQPFQMMRGQAAESRIGWSEVEQPAASCKFVTVNAHKAGPLSRLELRQAWLAAIGPAQLASYATSGAIVAGAGFFTPPTAEAVPKQLAPALDAPLVLCTIHEYEHDAVVFRNICRSLGTEINVRLLSMEQFAGPERLQADLILFSLMLDDNMELRLVDLFISMQLHIEESVARQIDGLLREITAEEQPDMRRTGLARIERLLAEHGLLLPLYRKHVKTSHHPSVKGVTPDPLGWADYRHIWFAAP